MTKAPTLTDGTVTLREHREDDIEGVYGQGTDPLFQRWTTVPVPYERHHAEGFVRDLKPRGWAEDTSWGFVVEHEGRYAGTIELRNRGEGRAEVAYGSHPSARGTGAMERGLRLLLDWGFTEKGVRTVIWWADRGNWASRKLAWRLGFSLDGTVRQWIDDRGTLVDSWVGTLTHDDPREPRSTWLDAPVLEGAGVRLRVWRDDDAERIVEACTDERSATWLGQLPSPYTLDDARSYLHDRIEVLASGQAVAWAVADAESDLLLGSLSLFDLSPGHQAEVGYWTHPDARGRGVMTEAVRLAIGHAFGPLGLTRLRAYAAVDNVASRHVLEANGFQQLGVERQAGKLKDGLVDRAAYDLLATDVG